MPSVLQANPWRFAGGSYDASVGRWTQQDPKAGSVFDARSSNRYVYAKCDPVNVTDPGGADAVDWYLALALDATFDPGGTAAMLGA
ncbi:MAG: RHS repeat-associated core domain-containing protein [Ktedonobacteraceae bacterium]